jgi:hypothetical protein
MLQSTGNLPIKWTRFLLRLWRRYAPLFTTRPGHRNIGGRPDIGVVMKRRFRMWTKEVGKRRQQGRCLAARKCSLFLIRAVSIWAIGTLSITIAAAMFIFRSGTLMLLERGGEHGDLCVVQQQILFVERASIRVKQQQVTIFRDLPIISARQLVEINLLKPHSQG